MKVSKLGHSCIMVEEQGVRILVDLGGWSSGFEGFDDIAAVFITHQHPDHFVAEKLKVVFDQSPKAEMYVDEGTAALLKAEPWAAYNVVRHGDAFQVGSVHIEVLGHDHAIIHPNIPTIPNVGYLIGGRLFHPGDNFTLPERIVEVLALPAGGPWQKTSEAIDYMLAVKPKKVFPIHDAVLGKPELEQGLFEMFAKPAGIEFSVIADGDTATF